MWTTDSLYSSGGTRAREQRARSSPLRSAFAILASRLLLCAPWSLLPLQRHPQPDAEGRGDRDDEQRQQAVGAELSRREHDGYGSAGRQRVGAVAGEAAALDLLDSAARQA